MYDKGQSPNGAFELLATPLRYLRAIMQRVESTLPHIPLVLADDNVDTVGRNPYQLTTLQETLVRSRKNSDTRPGTLLAA